MNSVWSHLKAPVRTEPSFASSSVFETETFLLKSSLSWGSAFAGISGFFQVLAFMIGNRSELLLLLSNFELQTQNFWVWSSNVRQRHAELWPSNITLRTHIFMILWFILWPSARSIRSRTCEMIVLWLDITNLLRCICDLALLHHIELRLKGKLTEEIWKCVVVMCWLT